MAEQDSNCAPVWRPIPGFEGIYSVSSAGEVRRDAGSKRCPTDRVLIPQSNGTGYLKVTLCGVRYTQPLIHRLVALAFIGPCPCGMQVNHKNGIKTDNRIENIEYVTPSGNQRHKYEVLGYAKSKGPEPRFGERHPHSRITADMVREIRRLSASGVYQRQIAERFGIGQTHVSKIVRRVLWPHVA